MTLILFFASVLIFIFLLPFLFIWSLRLKDHKFKLYGICIQHWILNAAFILSSGVTCTSTYQPIFSMRYLRKHFTRIDKIWVYGAAPLMYGLAYLSIGLTIELYALFSISKI